MTIKVTFTAEKLKTLMELTGLNKSKFADSICISRITLFRLLRDETKLLPKYEKLIWNEYNNLILQNMDKFKD